MLINSVGVSFASCSQDVTTISKSVEESMRSPVNVVASKSTSFERVVTVEIGSYRRKRSQRFQPPWPCRREHQPLRSSSCQHDQHVIQLRGNVAKQSRIKPQCRERQVNDGC